MGLPGNQILGTIPAVGHSTASAGTAFAALIEPQSAADAGRYLYAVDPAQKGANGILGKPNWNGQATGYSRVTKLIYTTANTGHKIGILRPFNYSYTTANAAINQAVIVLKDDPGTYSTNFRYPLSGTPSGGGGALIPAAVADNAIAGSDYVAYQLKDGTWILDTVASVSGFSVTLTTNIPNITGGGVLINTPVFFFGVVGDKDPNTGLVNWQTTTIANTNRQDLLPDYLAGSVNAMHRGDPLIFYSPNTTGAGILDSALGYYSPF